MTRMFRYFVLDMMCFWMIITDTRSTIVLQVPDTGLRCHTEEQLQCTIDSLPSSTTLTWIKGNSPIAECSPNCIAYANAPVRYTFSNTGNTTYTFVITNVTADDQDIYECSLSTSVVDTKQLDVASPLSPEHVFVQYSESTDETATVSTSTGCITNSPGTFTYFAYDNASGTTKTFNNYTNISTTPLDCDAAQYCNLPSVKNTTDIIKISKSHQKGKYLLRVGIGHLFIDTNVSIDIPGQESSTTTTTTTKTPPTSDSQTTNTTNTQSVTVTSKSTASDKFSSVTSASKSTIKTQPDISSNAVNEPLIYLSVGAGIISILVVLCIIDIVRIKKGSKDTYHTDLEHNTDISETKLD